MTNDYAHWNPDDPRSARSPYWDMTNGSLFSRNGWWYSGRVDNVDPDARSRHSTGSAIFRMNTRRADFRNVAVSLDLSVWEFGGTSDTPTHDYDGVHIWLRYQDQTELYYASIARRDGQVVIKKKCRGGRVNGGTYHELAQKTVSRAVPLFTPVRVVTTAVTNPDGSVGISLSRDGDLLVQATDRGVGCAPITGAGPVGIRGDNTKFFFRNFTVFPLP